MRIVVPAANTRYDSKVTGTSHWRSVAPVALLGALMIIAATIAGCSAAAVASPAAILWRNPIDIASRDLLCGSGGPGNAPHPPYTFVKEDLSGTNPKFLIRDGNGIEWNVKLGIEAQPEIAAARLLWAVGYLTDDEYYLPELHIKNMPEHLHRGHKLVAADGTVFKVRLKRKDRKKTGIWRWRDNPFLGTRELNGLKVMMALMNNWDLKDVNNAIYAGKCLPDSSECESLYLVSDLGASFSDTGRSWPIRESKGNLAKYAQSKFISTITAGFVDFVVPSRPALYYSVALPGFLKRLHLRGICKSIPRTDARWIGQILACLSRDQIRDAFRAAGYSPHDAEGFAQVVIKRIGELNKL